MEQDGQQKARTPEPARGLATCSAVLPVDPWEHRADRMRCATCMWFVPKATPLGLTWGLPSQDVTVVRPILGRCRRHCPTMSGYPAVYATDWCGDHKLDERKV